MNVLDVPLRHGRTVAASLSLALCMMSPPLFARDSGPRSDAPEQQAYLDEIKTKRTEQIESLRELAGIRDDQRDLWSAVERRLARLGEKSAEISLAARRNTSTRELDRLELDNAAKVANTADQRLVVDTLQWLYPQLDASQQQRIDRMYTGGDR